MPGHQLPHGCYQPMPRIADTATACVFVHACRHAGQAVELARLGRSRPVQRFLLDSKDNVLNAWRLFRRLGLREASLQNKLPYWES